MSETISPKHLWREAGIAGIVLGGVSIAYSLITMIIPAGVGGVMGNLMLSILRFAIWAAKFIGCIMLVKYFMKKLVAKYYEVDNTSTFNYGMAMSFLSALIVAAFTLAVASNTDTATVTDSVMQMMNSIQGGVDSNTQAAMEGIIDNLPTISFFSNLIYCFLFGTLISYIWSRRIPSRDPFKE